MEMKRNGSALIVGVSAAVALSVVFSNAQKTTEHEATNEPVADSGRITVELNNPYEPIVESDRVTVQLIGWH